MVEGNIFIECYYCKFKNVCKKEGDKCKIMHTDRGDKIEPSQWESKADRIYNDFMKGMK